MILYEKSSKYQIILIGIMIAFLLLDLAQFFLIGSIIIPLLVCLYSCILFYVSSPALLMLIAFLECIESFCFYNVFSLALIYLIPMLGIAFFIKKNMYPSFAHPILVAFLGTLIQIYAIESFFCVIASLPYYTAGRISAILLVTACFSLTINSWGMQGNRA